MSCCPVRWNASLSASTTLDPERHQRLRREAALSALQAFPGGLHVGGGVTPENAGQYLDAGVIVTSYVFRNGRLEEDRLNALVRVPKSFDLALRNFSNWCSRGEARCHLHAAVDRADLPCIFWPPPMMQQWQ